MLELILAYLLVLAGFVVLWKFRKKKPKVDEMLAFRKLFGGET